MSKENKRYYWLKLPQAYFSKIEQKKMRKQPNGKDMQIIYLRMMLACIDKSGVIYYQGVYDTIEEELAEEFDEDVKLIKATISYLKDNGMITINESNDCCVPEALEHIGSETASTQRSRECREKQKALQCNTNATTRNTEIEIEKENREELKLNKENREIDGANPTPSGIKILLNDKSYYEVSTEKIVQWKDTYPAVNVEQELKKMVSWCDANPARRKTRNGAERFINSWLSREQDRGGVYRGYQPPTQPKEDSLSYSDLYPDYHFSADCTKIIYENGRVVDVETGEELVPKGGSNGS